MDNLFSSHIDPELLVRFLSGDASETERLEVNRWIESDQRHRRHFEEMTLLWQLSSDANQITDNVVAEDWKKVRSRIRQNKPYDTFREKSRFPQFFRIAAAIAFLVSSYFVIKHFANQPAKLQTAIAAETTQHVILPDGSMAYLNKNARLIYPEKMNTASREVTLEGEAFFDIVKDPSRPFLINTGTAVTEVVGTSFNVNSDAVHTTVTVVTGRVRVHHEDDVIALLPGEQGNYTPVKGLTKSINTDVNFLSWKTGILTFRNTPLAIVLQDINRYYGCEIRIGTKALNSCTLTSTFSKQTLNEVLQEMELILAVTIRRQGDLIILTGKGC